MNGTQPTVALIHASSASIPPSVEAFGELFPEARLWHLLDDRLVTDAGAAGGITPPLYARMKTLIDYAVYHGADAVQLSCSLYGPVAQESDHPVPVLASDEAMFDAVADKITRRVLVLGSLRSAAEDSAERLRHHLSERDLQSEVVPIVVHGTAAATNTGNQTEVARLLAHAAATRSQAGDVVVLAQYSLAPAWAAVSAAVEVTVLSPSKMAASAMRARIGGSPR